jgi:hypothetical protein
MINFTLEKKAGAFDFDVQALDFYEILSTNVTKSEIETIKIGKKKEVFVSLETKSDEDDYSFDIYGKFDLDAFSDEGPNNIEDTVKEINKIVVSEGKSELFTISGLKLKADDLADGDTLLEYALAQSFTLTGNAAGNELGGGLHNDKSNGGGGDDILTGGEGKDLLNGGAGADIFVFAAGDGTDTIIGFRAKGADQDQIDLTAYEITFEDIEISKRGKLDVEITFIDGEDSILLKDVKLRDIDEADFAF